MKLRDFARRIKEDDEPDFAYTLQGGLDLTELSAEQLADFPHTIYIVNSRSEVFGKINKETLLYLLDRQQKFPFEQILNSMNDGVIAVDAVGRIFYANPAYVSILGVPLRRILGRSIQDVEPGSILNRALLERETFTREKQLIMSIQKYVSLRAFPLWDGKTVWGAVSIFKDVTKLHQMSREMHQMSVVMDEYSQRIRSQETADKLGITSYNKAFQTTLQKAATVALIDVPLLICGESGTGKNIMAHYLHQCSSRREKPFIVVNCAAVPDNMMEETLFGDGERPGKFFVADGGTLFLDEIEELPLSAQSQLLGFLQQDALMPDQERREAAPDVRLIAAANQPLEPMVREKRFRKELFFKLNTITIMMPPLRERQDDILPLANQFLSLYNEKYHRNVAFSSHIYQELQQYSWPGNLRELRSYVERSVILADSDLPILERAVEQDESGISERFPRARSEEPLAQQVRTFEKDVIQEVLVECGGNRTAAMRKLGLSRRTFYRKCTEFGILKSDEK